MKRICVCGHFGGDKMFYDGQTVKTKNVYEQLVNKIGAESVLKIDTYNWKRKVLSLFVSCVKNTILCTDIIILPAQNGVKLFIPLFNFLCKLFKKRLHYVMIGGWLPQMIANNSFMKRQLKKVHYIYAETHKVIDEFDKLGIKNVCFMRNFKDLKQSTQTRDYSKESVKCCIFSRIEKQKGIDDAIDIINRFNNNNENKVCLDIYGKVAEEYEEELKSKIENNTYIEYKGVVDADKSVQTLESYDLLLFPTRYMTEGVPGTIIDAYFAGLPVISSRWESFKEVIVEGITGIGYEMYNIDDFYDKFKKLINDKKLMSNMSQNCYIESKKYSPECALEILLNNMGLI